MPNAAHFLAEAYTKSGLATVDLKRSQPSTQFELPFGNAKAVLVGRIPICEQNAKGSIPHAVEIDLPLIAIMVSRGRQPSDSLLLGSEG